MNEFESLCKKLSFLLAGHPPDIQGAVLADLLALWLAGHVGPRAAEMREYLLALHIETVRLLIPINEKDLHADEPTAVPDADVGKIN